MILEILEHLVALDIDWLISLVIGNPIWVMLFAAAGNFLGNKKPFFAGTLLALYIHSTVDTAMLLGWTFQKGFWFIPLIIFFGHMLFDIFLGKTKYNVKRGIFTVILFYGAMLVVNVFIV